jgi:hypothetical protein
VIQGQHAAAVAECVEGRCVVGPVLNRLKRDENGAMAVDTTTNQKRVSPTGGTSDKGRDCGGGRRNRLVAAYQFGGITTGDEKIKIKICHCLRWLQNNMKT